MLAELENQGSIYLFRPLDMEAEEWCDENLSSDRQSFGKAIVIEPRFVNEIVMGFTNAGGLVEIS